MSSKSKAANLLLTGASGNYGSKVLRFLLKKMPANEIAALARDPKSLEKQAKEGVDVRKGDYKNYDSLVKAFSGIKTLLLVSAEAFSDRAKEETNAIDAAKEAGVEHIIYTSIQLKEGSSRKIPHVTEGCELSEKNILQSGMTYTILRNSLYMEALLLNLGNTYKKTGELRANASNGKAPLATCSNMAEAAANVLTEDGHENKIYTLGASEAFSFSDLADALSDTEGRKITYVDITHDQFVKDSVAAGMPQGFADFTASWFDIISQGDMAEVTKDLERLIKRKPMTYREVIASRQEPSAMLSY